MSKPRLMIDYRNYNSITDNEFDLVKLVNSKWNLQNMQYVSIETLYRVNIIMFVYLCNFIPPYHLFLNNSNKAL